MSIIVMKFRIVIIKMWRQEGQTQFSKNTKNEKKYGNVLIIFSL